MRGINGVPNREAVVRKVVVLPDLWCVINVRDSLNETQNHARYTTSKGR